MRTSGGASKQMYQGWGCFLEEETPSRETGIRQAEGRGEGLQGEGITRETARGDAWWPFLKTEGSVLFTVCVCVYVRACVSVRVSCSKNLSCARQCQALHSNYLIYLMFQHSLTGCIIIL